MAGVDAGPPRPFERRVLAGLSIWRFVRAPAGVEAVFTTRHGGVSGHPYDSLNLGFHVGDFPESVLKNRQTLFQAFGFDAAEITSPRQRHTAEVAALKTQKKIGSGGAGEESAFDPCDGLATSLKRAPLLLHFADCVPVILVGASKQGDPAVAILHAGRKGLIAGVIRNGVNLMVDEYDLLPESMSAAVGPAIRSCCYEVGEDVATGFEAHFGSTALVRDENRVWLDLHGATEAALLQAGLSTGNIHILDLCTSCGDSFFSYRRDGITGRHGAIAWIEST